MCPLTCAADPAVASVESALRRRADHKGGSTCEITVVSETGPEPNDPQTCPNQQEIPPGTRLRNE
jgi:hypothetical protein